MVSQKPKKRQQASYSKDKDATNKLLRKPIFGKKNLKVNDVLDNESINSEELESEPDTQYAVTNNSSSNKKEISMSEDEFEKMHSNSDQIFRIQLAKRYIEQLGYGSKPIEEVEKELDTKESLETENCVSTTFYSEVNVKPDFYFYKGHKGGVTSIALPELEPSKVFTGSKDCSIICWDLNTGKKTIFAGRRNQPKPLGGHFSQCLDVCCSPSGNTVISVGRDQVIRIWDPRVSTQSCLRELTGHQGAVTGVCIEPSSSFSYNDCVFYSTSVDKSLKQWSLAMHECIETFYGHTAAPCTINILTKQHPLTGGEDNTLRYWKIETGTHLLYGNQKQSVDTVGQLNNRWLLSGSQDASISLWSLSSRKPQYTIREPHGAGNWVTSLGCLKYSNVFFSGSNDGVIRCWKIPSSKNPEIVELNNANLLVNGFVTGIATTFHGFCVAAISNEHRLGRWAQQRNTKNGICVFRYSTS